MKKIIIGKNSAGQRLDRFLSKVYPALSQGVIRKALRNKDIKINGKRTEADYRLNEGEELTLYIKDELLQTPLIVSDSAGVPAAAPKPDIIYEDDNIILLEKEPGLVVHEDERGSSDTLIDRVKRYLYEKGEYIPENEQSFAPALCNRIDRNTGGIVIAAKNAQALRIMNQKIRDREMKKIYLCAVSGRPEKLSDTLTAYAFKNEKENRVIVSDRKTPLNRTMITKYKVLETNPEGDSLLLIDLITGRTHQIRAHMAYAGYPVLGDGKYGSNRVNREKGYKYQALYSYKLIFEFTTDAGILSYLDRKEFTAGRVWFLDRFTPDAVKNISF